MYYWKGIGIDLVLQALTLSLLGIVHIAPWSRQWAFRGVGGVKGLYTENPTGTSRRSTTDSRQFSLGHSDSMSETSKAKLRILLASSPYGGSLHEKLVEYLQASD